MKTQITLLSGSSVQTNISGELVEILKRVIFALDKRGTFINLKEGGCVNLMHISWTKINFELFMNMRERSLRT